MIELKTNIKDMGSYTIQFINCVAQERDGEHGLSHLVEHCMCEPIKKYQKKFKENGINWNAMTCQQEICFYMTGLNKNIAKFINDFTREILTYKITPDVFQRQKKIVIAEYKMYYSEQGNRFKFNWLRKHYNYTQVLGLLSDLQNITFQKFIQFKERITKKVKEIYFFGNKNQVIKLDDNIFSQIKYNQNEIQEIDRQFTIEKQQKYPLQKYTTGQSKQSFIYLWNKINFKGNKFKQLALAKLAAEYLLGGLTSYLYQEIRQKLGCVYAIIPDGNVFLNQAYSNYIFYTDKEHKQIVINQLNKVLPKLIKKLSKRTFITAYKSKIVQHKIHMNLNYTNFRVYVDSDIKEVNKYFQKRIITFEQFKEYINQFINNYKIFTDEQY